MTVTHWFNPLVYIISKEINKKCELSCDESVLNGLDEDERLGYGDTLIALLKAEGNYSDVVVSITLSEDATLLKERLSAIMGFKRKGIWATTFSMLLAVVMLCGATFTGAYAATPNITDKNIENLSNGTLTLDVKSANVIVEHSPTLTGFFFDFDQSKFTVEKTESNGSVTVTVRGPTQVQQSIPERVRLHLPLDAYSMLTVKGEDAGIQLPEIHGHMSIDSNMGSISYSVPKSFNKSISLKAIYSSIRVNIHKDLNNYSYKLNNNVSSVALTKGASSDFIKGNGKATISQTIEYSSYTMNWYEEKAPVEDENAVIVFSCKSNGQNSVTQSGYFQTESGKKLVLNVDSSIIGGTVDFFLFDPNGKEQKFTFKESGNKEIAISSGTWAYNCTGFFTGGDFTLIGTVYE